MKLLKNGKNLTCLDGEEKTGSYRIVPEELFWSGLKRRLERVITKEAERFKARAKDGRQGAPHNNRMHKARIRPVVVGGEYAEVDASIS